MFLQAIKNIVSYFPNHRHHNPPEQDQEELNSNTLLNPIPRTEFVGSLLTKSNHNHNNKSQNHPSQVQIPQLIAYPVLIMSSNTPTIIQKPTLQQQNDPLSEAKSSKKSADDMEEEEESEYEPAEEGSESSSSEEDEESLAVKAAEAVEEESVKSESSDSDSSSSDDEEEEEEEKEGDNEEEEKQTKTIVKKAIKSKTKPKGKQPKQSRKTKGKAVEAIKMDGLKPILVSNPIEIDFTAGWSTIEEEQIIVEDSDTKKKIKREYFITSDPTYKHPLPLSKRIQKKGRTEDEIKILESNKKKWESLLNEQMFTCLEHRTPKGACKYRMVYIDNNNVLRDWDYRLAKQVASKELIASAIENKNKAYCSNKGATPLENVLRGRIIIPQILYEKELAAFNKSTSATGTKSKATPKVSQSEDNKPSVIPIESKDPREPSNRAKIAAISRMNVCKNILKPEIYHALVELNDRWLKQMLDPKPKSSVLSFQEQVMALYQTIILDQVSFDTTMAVVDANENWKAKLSNGTYIKSELYCPPFIPHTTVPSTTTAPTPLKASQPTQPAVIIIQQEEKKEAPVKTKAVKKPSKANGVGTKRKESPTKEKTKQSKPKKTVKPSTISSASSSKKTSVNEPCVYMNDLELDELIKS